MWPFGVAHVIIGRLLDLGVLFGFLRAFDLVTREGRGREADAFAPPTQSAGTCTAAASARWPAQSAPPLHGRGLPGTRARRCHQTSDGQEETVAKCQGVDFGCPVDAPELNFEGVRAARRQRPQHRIAFHGDSRPTPRGTTAHHPPGQSLPHADVSPIALRNVMDPTRPGPLRLHRLNGVLTYQQATPSVDLSGRAIG